MALKFNCIKCHKVNEFEPSGGVGVAAAVTFVYRLAGAALSALSRDRPTPSKSLIVQCSHCGKFNKINLRAGAAA